MDKPTKPTDLVPRSFGGVKNNFSASLQSSGYEDGVPAIYGGDNLNYQLDATGKELDYCEKICDFINNIPIGNTIAVDSNNKLIYEENKTVRHIGEIVTSSIPLTDAGLHLLDGALIQGSGVYSAFVTYIAGLVTDYPSLFVTEAQWQTAVTTYGVCGKFVYDSVNNAVRLPKITGIIEGTTDITALGNLVEAGLPNIIGAISGIATQSSGTPLAASGVFNTYMSGGSGGYGSNKTDWIDGFNFYASRSSSIYGNSNTVQPQTIKVLYYIVIANSTKTDIEVDIDEIVTDLNGKADVDLTNINSSCKALDGQWVYSYLSIYSGNRLTANTDYSLASYLPNDNYNYEVLFRASTISGSTSGNGVRVYITSSFGAEALYLCYAITRASGTNVSRGSGIYPIGTDRKVTIVGFSTDVGTISLEALGYRRIGTNS